MSESSEIRLSISLACDSDGFLRRQCPNCEREFKWLPSQPDPTVPDVDEYYCPYCGQTAAKGSWLTPAQMNYAKAMAKQHLMQQLGADLDSISDLISIEIEGDDTPVKPSELDDMKRVDSPCHPSEPLKVEELWTENIHCLVCGDSIEVG